MSTTNTLDLNNRVNKLEKDVDELAKSYPAAKVMMSDGVTSVEDAVDKLTSGLTKKAHFYNIQGSGSVSVEASSCILFAKRDHQQSAYNVNAIYYLNEGNAWAMVNSGGNTNAISTSYSNGTITITNNNEVAIYACVIA